MKIYENGKYLEDIKRISAQNGLFDKLCGKSIVISGATGLIGSVIVDTVMYMNGKGLNCTVYALGRNKERAESRFFRHKDNPLFKFVKYDAGKNLEFDEILSADYIIHLASNTHPVQYATEPISTVTTNVIGLYNLLEYASKMKTKRVVFASSVEIYGENFNSADKFDENYCGYIDCNTLRAGYPESKRCGEALCQAYIKEKGLDIVIPRLCRVYGPTLLSSDTKALSQFIHKGVAGEDIVLKSAGTQFFSYLYVTDIVKGIFTVLINGKNGEAYNISDSRSDITLRDLAETIAKISGTKVIFEIPDEVERTGYSKATKAILSNEKIKEIGFAADYTISDGVTRTIEILREMGC